MPKLVEGFADSIVVPAGKRDVMVFDDGHKDAVPGFGIRKFASGKSSYIVKYAVAGQPRRQALGAVSRGNLKAMRLLASEVRARARLGQDLIAERRTAERAPGKKTIGSLIPTYLDVKRSELRPRSFKEVERHLLKGWRSIHQTPIGALTRADVVRVVDDLEERSGKVAADRARISLSTLLSWAIDRGHCDANPASDVKPRAGKSERSRVLSDTELAEIWRACRDDDHGRIVRLLMLSGQRKTEIGSLSRGEIDFARAQIELPGTRTRNGRPHIVPLSDAAKSIIGAALGRDAKRQLVFGTGVGGFTGWSKAKRELDERIADARRKGRVTKPMPPWVIHDLRRSFVTHMNDRGIAPPHVVEAVVNHVSGHLAGVAGLYNKAQYLPERRNALEAWAKHIRMITQAIGEAT
jgi:integrase